MTEEPGFKLTDAFTSRHFADQMREVPPLFTDNPLFCLKKCVCVCIVFLYVSLYVTQHCIQKLMEKRMCMVAFHSLRNAGVAVQDRAMGPVFTLK